jgi:hypothetical protein
MYNCKPAIAQSVYHLEDYLLGHASERVRTSDNISSERTPFTVIASSLTN